ncbi:MAG: hypothetical protein KatS3mg129_0794 [Leptospiraceae bacterium]|nr:MAG: hypothetical protein KatS3mg129_0794 [Leptospiraceae bacterium]
MEKKVKEIINHSIHKKKEEENIIEEKIDKIFEELNFLKLKYTSNLFLNLEDTILEKFAEKYSSILIYLLNILDKSTSSKLITKLTKNSVLYLIEEETRLLLLGEFRIEDDFEELAKISIILDEMDFSENENFLKKENFKEIKEALSILLKRRKAKEGTLKFNYLLNFDLDELRELIDLIVQKKPIIIPILMVFSPDSVKQFLLEEIVKKYPVILKALPEDIYELKYYTFLKDKAQQIIEYLPDEVIHKLEYLEIVKRLEEGLDRLIQEFKQKEYSERQKREKILNQVYEILISETPEIQELLLIDLLNKGYLSAKEVEILQLLFKQNQNV